MIFSLNIFNFPAIKKFVAVKPCFTFKSLGLEQFYVRKEQRFLNQSFDG